MSLFENLLEGLSTDFSDDTEIVNLDEELETSSLGVGNDLDISTDDSNINDVDELEQELKDDEGVDIDDIDDDDLSDIDIDDIDDDDILDDDILDEEADKILLKNSQTLDEELESLLDEHEVLDEELEDAISYLASR